MKKYSILLSVVAFFLFAACSNAQMLQKGDRIPEFSLPDQDGNMFNIDSVLGKKNLVIYFYPKDETPGCTKEACTFRDQYEVFKKADAKIQFIVIGDGLSEDSMSALKQLIENNNVSLIFPKIDFNFFDELKHPPILPHISRATYGRLLLTDIFEGDIWNTQWQQQFLNIKDR